MEAVSSEEFLGWAAGVGVGFDPRYPHSGCLRLLPPTEHARFWVLPVEPVSWPHFAASLLTGLDEWKAGLLWPRSACWPAGRQTQAYHEGVREVVLRGAGIPQGWRGAIRFERDEVSALLAVLFVYLALGECVGDDLFFIPDHGQQLIQTDHHQVIHAECTSAERVQQSVRHMAEAGYELPSEPPDGTFRRPPWMAKKRGRS